MTSCFWGITLISIVGYVYYLGIRHISALKVSMNITDNHFNRQDFVRQNRLLYGTLDREVVKDKRKIFTKTPSDLGF